MPIKIFCSVIDITFEMGYTDIDFNFSSIWQEMIHISKRSYLLADHSKFGQQEYVTLGRPNCIHEVITTEGISEVYVKYYSDNNIPVYVCS